MDEVDKMLYCNTNISSNYCAPEAGPSSLEVAAGCSPPVSGARALSLLLVKATVLRLAAPASLLGSGAGSVSCRWKSTDLLGSVTKYCWHLVISRFRPCQHGNVIHKYFS